MICKNKLAKGGYDAIHIILKLLTLEGERKVRQLPDLTVIVIKNLVFTVVVNHVV